jgi:hypothetical protein
VDHIDKPTFINFAYAPTKRMLWSFPCQKIFFTPHTQQFYEQILYGLGHKITYYIFNIICDILTGTLAM